MDVAVRVQDPSGSVARDVVVDVQEQGLVRDLVEALVWLFEWPRQTSASQRLHYELRREASPAPLDPHASLAELGLVHGSLLVLGPALPASGESGADSHIV